MCRCARSRFMVRSINKMTNVECRMTNCWASVSDAVAFHRNALQYSASSFFWSSLAERGVFSFVIPMDTQLTWYGQSAFKIVTPSGKVLLVDPWLSNPVFENAKDEIASLKHVDLILITHDHSDHVGDAVDIGKKTGAKLVATFDVADAMVKQPGYPAEQAQTDTVGHFGGELKLLDGEVKVAFVRAHHGSGVAADDRYGLRHGGAPGGFVMTISGVLTIYHTGDTDLFSDMALLSLFHDIDVMLVCIGDHFTMGPARAAEAVKLVKPRTAIPMHYGTFPILIAQPDALERARKKIVMTT